MIKVIGIGAGGHAKVVLDILSLMGGYEVVGMIDAAPKTWGTSLAGVRVVGDETVMAELLGQGVRHAFIGVGGVKSTAVRRGLYERTRGAGFEIVSAVHPRAVVAGSARLGAGATVMAGAVINAEAVLGENVTVNTGAIVEHDCVVESHAMISPAAVLAGAVRVGEGAYIGMGALVRQGIRVGKNAVVGAGAVVVRDVPDGVMVMGVPARAVRGSGG